jgi:hypothetical protein
MKRPGYREAIEWLASNDDCFWLGDENGALSVSAAMVRDLYDVTQERLIADLRRALKRAYPNHDVFKTVELSPMQTPPLKVSWPHIHDPRKITL